MARSLQLEMICGGYEGHAHHVAGSGLDAGLSLYGGAVHGRATLVLDTTPVRGAYRGYGVPQALVATEQLLELAAARLGIDGYEIRRRNLSEDSEPASLQGRARRCLDILERERGVCGPGRSAGIALATNISSISAEGFLDTAEARCTVTEDGPMVELGTVEIGQGIHRAAAAVAGEVWGMERDSIGVVTPETGLAPTDIGSFASRGAYVTLGAVRRAAEALQGAICAKIATEEWGKAGLDGLLTAAGTLVPWSELSGLTASATFSAPDRAHAVAAQEVILEIDSDTGLINPVQVTSVHDVGRVIDEERARLQVVGGVVQGLGWALNERPAIDGSMLRAGLPRLADAPPTHVHFLEEPNPQSPIGARGLGEIPINPVLGAVAAAVVAATGRPVDAIPVQL
jgi:CO/xanthine dehydrogenase Mo-binding subunit